MAWINSIQSMLPLPRPEPRSEAQIDNDLEDEFAFHIEQAEREFMDAGHRPDAARGLARARFRDVNRIKKRCKRIALEERIMLQRVNFVLMFLVTLMVIGVGAQVMITQRYNALALQAITTDLARMKFDAAAASREPAANAASTTAGNEGRVLVEGDVDRPGWYQIDLDQGTLLAEVLDKAQVGDNQWIRYRRSGETASPRPMPVAELRRTSAKRMVRPGEELRVENEPHASVRRSYLATRWRSNQIGEWFEVDEAGAHKPNGWTLQSVRETFGPRIVSSTSALLEHRVKDLHLKVSFDETALYVHVPNESSIQVGQWDYQYNRLVIDLSALKPFEPMENPPESQFFAAHPELRTQIVMMAADGSSRNPGFAFLEGDVLRSGTYQIPAIGLLTLSRFLAAAGVDLKQRDLKVVVWGIENDKNVLRYEASSFPIPTSDDYVIVSNDRVVVQAPTAAKRAQAIGDFILNMFTAVDPKDPNMDKTIRDLLNQAERDIEVKYAGDPTTASIIRELIAGRRKILDADGRFRDNALAEAKTKAVTDFLNQILVSTDPQLNQFNVSELLDKAAADAAVKLADQPEVQARVRAAIAEAQRNTNGEKATTQPVSAGDAMTTPGSSP